MDLLATVRKEGSRGGRGDFKWTDVQNSSHRENYLGHSVMAPVGRWQKGKDLGWYSKGGTEEEQEKAALERKEEIRRVKEAEQDAMAKALGLPVPDRNNANLQEVSDKRDFDKVVKESVDGNTEQGGKGVGFGNAISRSQHSQVHSERIEGNAEAQDKELALALKEYNRRHNDHDRRRRSRSRDRERKHRQADRSRGHKHESRHGRESREDERSTRRHPRSRSRSRSRDRRRQDREYRRSRSPRRQTHDGDRSGHRRRHD